MRSMPLTASLALVESLNTLHPNLPGSLHASFSGTLPPDNFLDMLHNRIHGIHL